MTHEIRVPVGLEEKVVSITVDAESGKAFIRVDGKMTGRPLSPDEDRREIRIGDDLYELRREWNEFDLEFVGPAIAPAAPAPGRATSAQVPKASSSPSFPVGKTIMAILVMVVGGWLYRPVAELLVDWKQFRAPDHSFAADMPGQVVEAKLGSFAKTAGARAWVAERNGKIFEIGYVEIPPDIKPEWENEFINGVRDSIAKKYKGKVVNDEDWPGGTELMISCDAWKNTSDGPSEPRDVRIRIMIRGDRVVMAAASAPPREIMSWTVTRFFMSVKA